MDPDDPEYDHTDPEDDGQTGRGRRLHAPSGAPQTQEIRAEAQGGGTMPRSFDRPNGSGGHPKALPPERSAPCAPDDKGITGFTDGPGGIRWVEDG